MTNFVSILINKEKLLNLISKAYNGLSKLGTNYVRFKSVVLFNNIRLNLSINVIYPNSIFIKKNTWKT